MLGEGNIGQSPHIHLHHFIAIMSASLAPECNNIKEYVVPAHCHLLNQLTICAQKV